MASGRLVLMRSGKTVSMCLRGCPWTQAVAPWTTVDLPVTVPEGYRPVVEVVAPVAVDGQSSASIYVLPNGTTRMNTRGCNYRGGSNDVFACASWVTP